MRIPLELTKILKDPSKMLTNQLNIHLIWSSCLHFPGRQSATRQSEKVAFTSGKSSFSGNHSAVSGELVNINSEG